MSQIIEIKDFSSVRFSILSENKIQLEYKVSIISQDYKIEEFKMKFRYRKNGDIWVYIPIKEKFIIRLSISYGIKKRNIIINNRVNINKNIFIDGVEYRLSNLFNHFTFNDISWHRNMLLKTLLSK